MQYYLIPSQHETSSFLGRGPSGFCKRGDEIICLSVRISAPAHSRLEIKLSVRARRREQEARDSRHFQRSTALRPHQQYSAHPVSTRLKARPPPFAIVPQTIPADFTTLVVRVSPLCVPTCIWCTKLGSHTTLSSQIRYTVATDSHRPWPPTATDSFVAVLPTRTIQNRATELSESDGVVFLPRHTPYLPVCAPLRIRKSTSHRCDARPSRLTLSTAGCPASDAVTTVRLR